MEIYEKKDVHVKWNLLQYVTPVGNRDIDSWRSGLSVSRRAEFDIFMRNLVKKARWTYPDVGGLAGKHLKGIVEIRWKSEGVPHRIGGYFTSPDEFVMLIGWTHNAKKYDPPSALETLVKRVKQIKTGEATLCEYTIFTGRSA